MPRVAIFAAPVLLTLATACQSESPAETPPPPKPPAEDTCGTAKVSRFLGQEATAAIEAEISADTAGPTRTIRPGDAVTMDFRPDRLNIELDESGKIKRLRCG